MIDRISDIHAAWGSTRIDASGLQFFVGRRAPPASERNAVPAALDVKLAPGVIEENETILILRYGPREACGASRFEAVVPRIGVQLAVVSDAELAHGIAFLAADRLHAAVQA